MTEPELPLGKRHAPTELMKAVRRHLGVCLGCGVLRTIDPQAGLCLDCQPKDKP